MEERLTRAKNGWRAAAVIMFVTAVSSGYWSYRWQTIAEDGVDRLGVCRETVTSAQAQMRAIVTGTGSGSGWPDVDCISNDDGTCSPPGGVLLVGQSVKVSPWSRATVRARGGDR